MSATRTRIAPSPTGEDLHVGTLATALVNYAVAKKHGGTFVVRIEDTDRTRFVAGAEEKFLQVLLAFGINYDEAPGKEGEYGPYRQSERLELYLRYARELVEKGAAYYCTCSKARLTTLREEQQKQKQVPRYDKHCLNQQEEVKKTD
jgi:glutamyl-tRNA synthetase